MGSIRNIAKKTEEELPRPTKKRKWFELPFGKAWPEKKVHSRIIGQPGHVKVVVPAKPYLKMKYYIKHAKGEIGGVGLVRKKGNIMYVEDVFLLKQTATASHFQVDGKELAQLVSYFAKSRPDDLPLMKLWWHSHCNHRVFWSAEDDDTFNVLLNHNHHYDYVVGIVGNKRNEMLARVDVDSKLGTIRFDNVTLDVTIDDRRLEEEIKKEVKNKVNNRLFTPPSLNPARWWG